MYILKEGRRPYLEFLRNLTPQIFILGMAVIAGKKLDWNRFAFDNPVGNFLFWGLLLIFVSAAWANGAEFLEHAIAYLKDKESIGDYEALPMTVHEKIRFFLKHHFWRLAQMILALFIVEIGIASVVVVGLVNASSWQKLLH